jgi:hypothetical protein
VLVGVNELRSRKDGEQCGTLTLRLTPVYGFTVKVALPTTVVPGYVTLMVYVPAAAELAGKNPSPEPATNEMEKFEF